MKSSTAVTMLLVLIAVLGLLGTGASAPTAFPRSLPQATTYGQWVVDVGHLQVGQGTPVLFIVTGPPNSNFTVNVTGEPFGHSYPVFVHSYATPNDTYNRTGIDTTVNLTIPTDSLPLAGYLVNITAGPVEVGTYVINVELAVNLAELNDTIANQTQQIQIYRNDLLTFSSEVTFWTTVCQALAIFAGLVLTFAIVLVAIRDRQSRNPEFLARTRDLWKWFLYGSGIRSFTPELVDAAEPAPRLDPDRFFRGAYCDRCKRNAWSREEIVAHLLVDHADILNSADPQENVDYITDQRLLAEIRSSSEPLQGGRRRDRARRDALAIDIDALDEPVSGDAA
jgi:hypothetical protein